MKKIASTFVAILLFAVYTAIAQSNYSSIKNGNFNINGCSVAPVWQYAPLDAALGQNSVNSTSEYVHIFHASGVVVFERSKDGKGTGEISEVQIFYSASSDKNTPEKFYSGVLRIEKLSVNKTMTITTVRNQLKNYIESKSYLAHNYRFEKSGIYMYFEFNESETELVKICIGKDSN